MITAFIRISLPHFAEHKLAAGVAITEAIQSE